MRKTENLDNLKDAMAKRSIILEGNSILRTKLEPVSKIDHKIQNIIKDMHDTLNEPTADGQTGIGLAANQIGFNARIVLVTFNVESKKNAKIITMINPEILEISKNNIIFEEGCLSIPGTFAKISRPEKIYIRWKNEKGNWAEKKIKGWDARIFLHEYDHLEGKLFTDYL